MLHMSILEFLVTAVPEGLIYVLALYVLGKQPIEGKKYWIASAIQMVMIFSIRLLPISYGIHTILIMTSLIIIGIRINKLDAIVVGSATISTVILHFISETITMKIFEKVMGQDISSLILNQKLKIACSITSLFILLIVILIIKRRYKQHVQCGESSKSISG